MLDNVLIVVSQAEVLAPGEARLRFNNSLTELPNSTQSLTLSSRERFSSVQMFLPSLQKKRRTWVDVWNPGRKLLSSGGSTIPCQMETDKHVRSQAFGWGELDWESDTVWGFTSSTSDRRSACSLSRVLKGGAGGRAGGLFSTGWRRVCCSYIIPRVSSTAHTHSLTHTRLPSPSSLFVLGCTCLFF